MSQSFARNHIMMQRYIVGQHSFPHIEIPSTAIQIRLDSGKRQQSDQESDVPVGDRSALGVKTAQRGAYEIPQGRVGLRLPQEAVEEFSHEHHDGAFGRIEVKVAPRHYQRHFAQGLQVFVTLEINIRLYHRQRLHPGIADPGVASAPGRHEKGHTPALASVQRHHIVPVGVSHHIYHYASYTFYRHPLSVESV